ncbi:MAG TPA: hypothetical protein VMB23_08815 [Spirochaetia bacterium]|nr:hypothetical protein [Spirochaetia bacterium]
MKLLSTALSAGLVAAALAFTGCSSATTNNPAPVADTGKSSQVVSLPTNWTALGTSSSTATLAGGYQNSIATLPVPTFVQTGDQSYRSMVYASGGAGTTAWVTSPLYAATSELKTVLKLHYSGSDRTKVGTADSHVLINFGNLDLSTLSTKTGVTFAVRVPHLSANDFVHNTGFSVLVRKRTTTDENAAVYVANLGGNDNNAGTIGTTNGGQSDWVYWGDENLFVFKVPFDFFVVPGWFSSDSEPSKASTIAAALTAGTVFNSIDLDFRFNAAGSSYSDDVEYPCYVSGLALY